MTKNVDELDMSRFSSIEEYNKYFMEVYQLPVFDPEDESVCEEYDDTPPPFDDIPEDDYFRQEDW